VTLDGRPGVWFFSLDCASMLAVIGARLGIHLPYFSAAIRMTRPDSGKHPPLLHFAALQDVRFWWPVRVR